MNTVTIIGANGTMGSNVSAIFASFGRCKVFMISRSLEKSEEAIEKACQSIKSESIRKNLIPCDYSDLESCVKKSDFIFESVSEDIELKKVIYDRISPVLTQNSIMATGTSGLSIKELSHSFGEKKDQFFGVHFFNPPYNLTLCEVVSHSNDQKNMEIDLINFLENTLDRSVVRVQDTPSFLGNRIGFFFINEAFLLSEKYKEKGGIDYIDAIIGRYSGRSMPPLLTADFVGLDTTKAILDYTYTNTLDNFSRSFKLTDYMNYLIKKGYLGKKTNKGLYERKENNQVWVFDVSTNEYRPRNNYNIDISNKMIELIRVGKYQEAFSELILDESTEAIILKEILLKYVVYSIKISFEYSNDISDADTAMVTGYSWIPPISLIKLFGGLDKFIELAEKYLSREYIDVLSDWNLISKIPKESKYDYREYLRGSY